MQDIPKITCPTCGQEYLFNEIYNKDYFFGKPKNIQKTSEGKIISFDGIDMDLEEEYICDGCNTPLSITASLNFNITTKEKFEEEFTTTFSKPKKINLEEETLFQ